MSQPIANSVPSIDRALTVLELLAQTKKGLSISEMSRKLLLPKSSVHLILRTLERRGYLQKNPHTGKFFFGLKLLSLSRSTLENLELREEAQPFLVSLMRKTNLTVHMAVLERNEAVIIEKIEPQGMIKVATWIGRRMDVNCTGVGKALIAFIPEEEFDQQINAKGFTRHNHKSITSLRKLRRELSQVRELGYALDDEEDEVGLRCVGAPIFNSHGKVAAAISVAGTTTQITPERIHAITTEVKRAAEKISLQLGYLARHQP